MQGAFRRIAYFLMLLVIFAFAREKRIITPEDVVNLKLVTSAVLSPDGKTIAYTFRVPRTEDDAPGAAYSEIWVIHWDGSGNRRLTAEKQNAYAPQWSPHGDALYFLGRRGNAKHVQVYALPMNGGEPYPVTEAPASVAGYAISPDGKWIAYRYTTPLSADEKKARQAGKDWTEFERNFRFSRIHLKNLATGKDTVITPNDRNVWSFIWSPTSDRIIYTASAKPLTDDSYMFKKIYQVTLPDFTNRLVVDPTAKIGAMAVSPNGKVLAYLAGVDIHDPTSGTLFTVDLTTGTVTNISGDLEGTNLWVDWYSNSQVITVTEEGVYTNILLWKLSSKTHRTILKNGPIFTRLSWNRKAKRFAFAGSTPTHPNELYVARWKKTPVRLTNSNPWLKEIRFAKQEVIQWKAKDGLTIEGILLKPLDFKEGTKYPLVVQVHGGPESAYLNGWITYYSRWSQLLAARGYMVLMPNYRGSTGRGTVFSKADHKDLAGKEFDDVLAGIDYLIQKGWVDPDKVGIGGGSYGGYFSAWAATRHSQRFAASVVFAGISNWISFTGTTDIPHENSLVHWAMYWYDNKENEQKYWERSPLAHIRNAQTPTLICHGEKDLRVPLGQGKELYRALTIRNVPTELVIYPREPHGLRERAHQLDFINRVLNWYDKYLK